jgi:hypothetical protein
MRAARRPHQQIRRRHPCRACPQMSAKVSARSEASSSPHSLRGVRTKRPGERRESPVRTSADVRYAGVARRTARAPRTPPGCWGRVRSVDDTASPFPAPSPAYAPPGTARAAVTGHGRADRPGARRSAARAGRAAARRPTRSTTHPPGRHPPRVSLDRPAAPAAPRIPVHQQTGLPRPIVHLPHAPMVVGLYTPTLHTPALRDGQSRPRPAGGTRRRRLLQA